MFRLSRKVTIKRSNAHSHSNEEQEGLEGPRKRVNSKEDGADAEDDSAEVPKRISSDSEIDRKSSRATVLTKADLESKLKQSILQIVAEKALTLAHCNESFRCLVDIFAWEDETEPSPKAELEEKIRKEYIAEGSASEIFLPERLRKEFLDGGASLNIIKSHVLNDLRFNQVLLNAITV